MRASFGRTGAPGDKLLFLVLACDTCTRQGAYSVAGGRSGRLDVLVSGARRHVGAQAVAGGRRGNTA